MSSTVTPPGSSIAWRPKAHPEPPLLLSLWTSLGRRYRLGGHVPTTGHLDLKSSKLMTSSSTQGFERGAL